MWRTKQIFEQNLLKKGICIGPKGLTILLHLYLFSPKGFGDQQNMNPNKYQKSGMHRDKEQS